jgi:uncharacterized Zn finger protein (UPF0148 family)
MRTDEDDAEEFERSRRENFCPKCHKRMTERHKGKLFCPDCSPPEIYRERESGLVFTSAEAALRHLANVTGKTVRVANLDGPVTADDEEKEEDNAVRS